MVQLTTEPHIPNLVKRLMIYGDGSAVWSTHFSQNNNIEYIAKVYYAFRWDLSRGSKFTFQSIVKFKNGPVCIYKWEYEKNECMNQCVYAYVCIHICT